MIDNTYNKLKELLAEAAIAAEFFRDELYGAGCIIGAQTQRITALEQRVAELEEQVGL
jgi:polyhydroxyalkanoate synthesis regulator phasin